MYLKKYLRFDKIIDCLIRHLNKNLINMKYKKNHCFLPFSASLGEFSTLLVVIDRSSSVNDKSLRFRISKSYKL